MLFVGMSWCIVTKLFSPPRVVNTSFHSKWHILYVQNIGEMNYSIYISRSRPECRVNRRSLTKFACCLLHITLAVMYVYTLFISKVALTSQVLITAPATGSVRIKVLRSLPHFRATNTLRHYEEQSLNRKRLREATVKGQLERTWIQHTIAAPNSIVSELFSSLEKRNVLRTVFELIFLMLCFRCVLRIALHRGFSRPYSMRLFLLFQN